MKERKRTTAVIAMIVCVCLIAAAMFVSFVKFNSINLPKIIYAVAAVSSGSEDYVVIRENYKKVIIADPNDPDAFSNYLESIAYTELEEEQMGGIHVIEKDGEKELVSLSANGYYRLWLWQN